MKVCVEEQRKLKTHTGVNKPVMFKYKGEKERYRLGTVVDAVGVVFQDYHHVFQRIRLDHDVARRLGATIAYRLGYYTLSAEARRPTWGQYHQTITEKDFRALLAKAARKGWLGPRLTAR